MEENQKIADSNDVDQADKESNEQVNYANTSLLEEMAKAGILSGRKRSKTNPRMKKYVYTTRNSFEVIDLDQTASLIEEAGKFLREAVKKGQPILFVGTRPPAQASVKNMAEKLNFPYVVERWLGGTLSNFEVINKRLNFYLNLKSDQATGKLEKYTKKERTEIDKKLEKMDRLFGGLEKLTSLPAAIVIIGADSHEIAIKEAKITKIPIVAVANTSADPDNINYIIPANDNSKESIDYILAKLEESISTGLKDKNSPPNPEDQTEVKN